MYDEPLHGGLVDKHFIYTLIIICIIIGGAFMVINRLDIFGEKFHGGSWYIYCDLEHKTCSCNTYGLLDEPRDTQIKLCIDFMKEYYTKEVIPPPIIITPPIVESSKNYFPCSKEFPIVEETVCDCAKNTLTPCMAYCFVCVDSRGKFFEGPWGIFDLSEDNAPIIVGVSAEIIK